MRQNKVIKFFKRCWVILAFLIIIAAVISSLFRSLTPWAKQYKTEVEHHLSRILGETVLIDSMETGWYWFEPVIKLNQISISDAKQEVVKLSKLLMGINLFSSFWHWQIQPGVLLIEDLQLGLHQETNSWQIDGLEGLKNPQITWDAATLEPILAWVLDQQKIIIKNFSARIHLLNGRLIPVSALDLQVVNHSGHYTIKGKGYLAQTTATAFQLLADLDLRSYALNKTRGKVFFSVNHLLPTQWQGFVPKSRFNVLSGKGNFQLWAEIGKGRFKNIQARVNFHHLALADKQTQKNQLIQLVKANLAWKPSKDGWQLAGDQVHLRLGDLSWPENSFIIRYNKVDQSYFFFVKDLLLESVLASSMTWLGTLNPFLAMKPHGQLHDTQIELRQNGIHYVLTRFSALGWQAFDLWPGFENLSGVLHWQPTEGRLKMGSKEILITQIRKKPIRLSALNAAFDWRKLDEGFRLNLERFVINHPNLLLSARAVVDKISANSLGQLKLTGVFSANKAEHLVAYLPEKSLKPTLEVWLKKEVKRIDELSGDLLINGPVADFPFDKQTGDFIINSYFKGVDLIFARNWSLTKDLEGYLHVNKRNLEADIVHANLQGIIINKANLRIDDIGHDKEVLLLRTKVKTQAGKALSYTMSSPLNKQLSALSLLHMQGLLSLDLQLEAPLYPENNKILALGELHFMNDKINVRHSLDEIAFNHLKGNLQFNQEGILNSNLQATLHNCSTNLAIRTIHQPIPYTEVKLAGKAKAEVLKKRFNLPIFSLMHGSLMMNSTLKLTDDPNDLDHLRVQTSLDGLGIDLPPPLGKIESTKAPLTVDIDFNPEKAVRLRFNYDNRLSADLWFSRPKGTFQLQRGELRVGAGYPQNQSQQGLQIVGSLPYFDLQQWLDIKAKLPAGNEENTLIEALNRIDLRLQDTKLWKEKYKNFIFRAAKLPDDDWTIELNQKNMRAKLHYQPTSNTLSGQFDTLRLAKKTETKQTLAPTSPTLKPTDIPNLDLFVASFQVGDLDLGTLNLKTKSKKNLWHLDYCKITSPSYALMIKGEWKQEGILNATNLGADLQINDLAASLQRWKINPAVEAKQGDIQFQGQWASAFPDFQLAKVKGQLTMDFKNGRITNLSPETEEKLGLGKLLSILSLQTIPRRLKLDFSDLSSAGFSFDKFQGHFNLENGIMTTEDSYIDGPVAYATMKGNLDIVNQNYEVDLKISPYITASLPIVATIAGGPVVGLATWVASKIINQGMQKISGYTYRVTGPWRKPLVQQVTIIKKRRIPLRA